MWKSPNHPPLSEKNDNSQKLSTGLSVIDPQWELLDPTPNIHDLFVIFNDQFFWGSLGCVRVEWSPRMTTCAGICYFQGVGGVRIGLSKPLLKLRPRKDLVETLLHEMIHAYLFVTRNFKDRSDHGPEFRKHMDRINQASGAKITVYHDFHDEVSHYKVHWWRCNGPCSGRAPFYGIVKRATNRAPGPNDRWWAEHQMLCNGQFIKIKEPDGFKAKTKKRNEGSSETSQGSTGSFKTGGGGGTKTLVRGAGSKTIVSKNPNLKDPNALSAQKLTNNIHGFSSSTSSYKQTGKQSTLDSYLSPPNKGSGVPGNSSQNRPTPNIYPNAPPKPRAQSNVATFNSLCETSSTSSSSGPSAFTGQGYVLGGSRPLNQSSLLIRSSGNQGYLLGGTRSSGQSVSTDRSSGGPPLDRSRPSTHSVLLDRSQGAIPKTTLKISGIKKENNPESENVPCPVCNQSLPTEVMNVHLDECLEGFETVEVSDDENEGARSLDPSNFVPCPNCTVQCSVNTIHEHLDACLTFLEE